MQRSEMINELASALALAQAQVKGAVKDVANPFFKSKYADLASVWDACREALSSNGLSVVQAARSLEAGVEVETMLLHASGQWISESLALPVSKADAQGFGSALTYCRRYGLAAMVGVAPEDDDGNAAATAKPGAGEFKPTKKDEEAAGIGTIMPLDRMPIERQKEVNYHAGRVIDAFTSNQADLAFANYDDARTLLDKDELIALGAILTSAQRTALKTMAEARKKNQLKAMAGSQA